jgi:hypothetical protein
MTKPSKREALTVLTIKRLGSLCDDFDLDRVGLRRKQDFIEVRDGGEQCLYKE